MFWDSIKQRKPQMPSQLEALPGRSRAMEVSPVNIVLNTPQVPPFNPTLNTVYFGMGCFWGAEKYFWQTAGIYTTAVGYGAGYTPNPTYEEVCSGQTGHNELVMVVYDPNLGSFQELLKAFWQGHNPTEGMKQGNDIGTQYRSGIYATNESQLKQAELSQQNYDRLLSASGLPTTTTEIKSQITFYYAEDYHQQYLAKNPNGYCPNHTCAATGLPEFDGDI